MLSVRCLVCPVLSVCDCDVRALWPNGWTDQDKTWHAGKPCLPPSTPHHQRPLNDWFTAGGALIVTRFGAGSEPALSVSRCLTTWMSTNCSRVTRLCCAISPTNSRLSALSVVVLDVRRPGSTTNVALNAVAVGVSNAATDVHSAPRIVDAGSTLHVADCV